MYALSIIAVDTSSNLTIDNQLYFSRYVGPLIDKIDELTNCSIDINTIDVDEIEGGGVFGEVTTGQHDCEDVMVKLFKVEMDKGLVKYDLT